MMPPCFARVAPRAALALALLPFGPPPAAAQASRTPSPADSVRSLADAGLPDEALDHARAAVRHRPGDPAAFAALAIGAMAVEDWDGAVEAADALVARAPDVSAHALLLGQAYLSHARANPSLGAIGRVRKGRAAVERAIALDPGNLDARYTLMQFLLQAPGFAGGSRDQARRQATEIEARDRTRGLAARLEVATAAGKKEELRRVVGDALPLLAATPDTSTLLLGAFLGAVGTLDDEALREELTAAIYAARPRHPVAAYHRARLWVIEGERLGDAERLLLAYLEGPERRGGAASRAGAHWRLAQLYERQDRDDHAEEQYRLAATLDPRLRAKGRLPARVESQI
jgi:tetratricopeptide (TPR) repeat protein